MCVGGHVCVHVWVCMCESACVWVGMCESACVWVHVCGCTCVSARVWLVNVGSCHDVHTQIPLNAPLSGKTCTKRCL